MQSSYPKISKFRWISTNKRKRASIETDQENIEFREDGDAIISLSDSSHLTSVSKPNSGDGIKSRTRVAQLHLHHGILILRICDTRTLKRTLGGPSVNLEQGSIAHKQ